MSEMTSLEAAPSSFRQVPASGRDIPEASMLRVTTLHAVVGGGHRGVLRAVPHGRAGGGAGCVVRSPGGRARPRRIRRRRPVGSVAVGP